MVGELSVQEQKYAAVMAVLTDGRSVSEVAQALVLKRRRAHPGWVRGGSCTSSAGSRRRVGWAVSRCRRGRRSTGAWCGPG